MCVDLIVFVADSCMSYIVQISSSFVVCLSIKALLLINFVPIELFKIKLKQVHCDVCFTK